MFKIGDIVAFLDEPGTATVKKVEGNTILVIDENGFEDEYLASQLILRKQFEVDILPTASKPMLDKDHMPLKGVTKQKAKNYLECDLHFSQLVIYPKNYSSHQRLSIQLNEAQKALSKAQRAGIKRVILVHGVGQGILKEEVHKLLERKEGLRFYDASFAEFGRGATEVEFF